VNRSRQLSELNHPAKAAKAVGLRYVSHQRPGIQREPVGKGFRYLWPRGKEVRDTKTLRRIKSVAIPPAWKEVWISTDARGHLQATGRDARWRKQHRYHPRWREIRDATKYSRLVAFGRALPRLRRRVRKALRLPGLPRAKVLATVVRLLEVSLIRVGNDEYARENSSFGLTTMKDHHVQVKGGKLRFRFRGKSGKRHDVDIEDRRLARIVKRCQELPGQELFQFIDDEGRHQDVHSGDVNDYLREITGQDFTAKDFRTWAGTVLAAVALREFEEFDSKAEANRNILRAIESVAARLGNTVAICRKCYVHPEVIDAYVDGTLLSTLKQRAEQELAGRLKMLSPEEAAVLGLLQQRLGRARNHRGALIPRPAPIPLRSKRASR
jgi:DNA topoisomerase-1